MQVSDVPAGRAGRTDGSVYIRGVIRSRRILVTAALTALAAWANVQAMACCVIAVGPADPVSAAVAESAVSAAETPMAADHSCCPGAASGDAATESQASAVPVASDAEASAGMPGCGMQSDGTAALCCESGEVAAVSAKTVVSDGGGLELAPVVSSRLPVSSAASFAPGPVSSSPPDGAPPFLSYQRLLI